MYQTDNSFSAKHRVTGMDKFFIGGCNLTLVALYS